MTSLPQFLAKTPVYIGASLLVASLTACGGGGGSTASNDTSGGGSTVTSSSIALPSSVQVVTAN